MRNASFPGPTAKDLSWICLRHHATKSVDNSDEHEWNPRSPPPVFICDDKTSNNWSYEKVRADLDGGKESHTTSSTYVRCQCQERIIRNSVCGAPNISERALDKD